MLIFGLLLIFVMTAAFIAGWGNMIKSAVAENNFDEPYMIIKDFIPGVGEYFFPSIGFMANFLLINIVSLALIYFIGMHFIGDAGINSDLLTKAMANNEALKSFLTSLSTEQIVKLNMWNMLTLGIVSLFYFLIMLYLPALFLESKNPFKALFLSLKHTFSKKFISVAGIYILIFCINFFISIFSAIFAGNTIMSFLMTLINFYFVNCAVIGLFYYYNKCFINPHLGNSIDTFI